MTDSWDDFAEQLQQQIFEETREIYGEEAFWRWQNPKYMARMETPSSYGRITGVCGDTMEVYLRIEDDRIIDASFYTDGCGSSMVCGSVAAELAIGRDVDEAAAIGGDTILEVLGKLPPEEQHCAFLAAESLHAAIHNWVVKNLTAERHEET